MKNINIVSITAAVILTSVQLVALAASVGAPSYVNQAQQYSETTRLLAQSSLPPVIVLGTRTD